MDGESEMICGKCHTNLEQHSNLQIAFEQVHEAVFPAGNGVKTFDHVVDAVRELLSENVKLQQENFELQQENFEFILGLGLIEEAAGFPSHTNPTPDEIARKIAGLQSASSKMLQQSKPAHYGVSDFQSVAEIVGSLAASDRVRVMRAVAAYFGIEGDMG